MLTQELVRIGDQATKAAENLFEKKKGSRRDLLQARIESKSALNLLQQARNQHLAAWRMLAAILESPEMPPTTLSGLFDETTTVLAWEQSLRRLPSESPEISTAFAQVDRARWAVDRARAEAVPDVNVQAIIQDDNSTAFSNAALLVSMPIPLLYRNRGGIRQAESEPVRGLAGRLAEHGWQVIIEGLPLSRVMRASEPSVLPSQARAKKGKPSHSHMIRRFFCLLLVPLMLANQGLCFAHTHHGTDVAEPEGHASRPHFHVGGHVHHDRAHNHQHADHSHPDHSDNVPDSDEHDSDAVYCGAPVTIACGGNSANVLPEKDVVGAAILQVANQNDGLRHLGRLRCQPPSVYDAACPIYLRTLSLRI